MSISDDIRNMRHENINSFVLSYRLVVYKLLPYESSLFVSVLFSQNTRRAEQVQKFLVPAEMLSVITPTPRQLPCVLQTVEGGEKKCYLLPANDESSLIIQVVRLVQNYFQDLHCFSSELTCWYFQINIIKLLQTKQHGLGNLHKLHMRMEKNKQTRISNGYISLGGVFLCLLLGLLPWSLQVWHVMCASCHVIETLYSEGDEKEEPAAFVEQTRQKIFIKKCKNTDSAPTWKWALHFECIKMNS